MSNPERISSSWDSDEELLGSNALTFEKELDKTDEDELLGCSDDEGTSVENGKIQESIKSHSGCSADDLSKRNTTYGNTNKWHRRYHRDSDDEEDDEDNKKCDVFCENIETSVKMGASSNHDTDEVGNDDDDDVTKMDTGFLSSKQNCKSHMETNEEEECNNENLKATEEESRTLTGEEEVLVGRVMDDNREEELDYEEEDEEEENDNKEDEKGGSWHKRRFVSERIAAPGPINRVGKSSDIPDTLEISKEDEKKIEQFVNKKSFQQRSRPNNNRNNYKNVGLQSQQQQQQTLMSHPRFPPHQIVRTLGNISTPLRPPPSFKQHHMESLSVGSTNFGGKVDFTQTIANAAVNLLMQKEVMQHKQQQQPQLAIGQRFSSASLPIQHRTDQNLSFVQHQMFAHPRFQKAAEQRLLDPMQAFQGQQNPVKPMSSPMGGNQQQMQQLRGSLLGMPSGIQVVNQMRPTRPHSVLGPPPVIHSGSQHLAQPIMGHQARMVFQQNNGPPIQVVSHPNVHQMGHPRPLFQNAGSNTSFLATNSAPSHNLNMHMQPQQNIIPKFIQQPPRTFTPLEQRPQNATGFVVLGGNNPNIEQQRLQAFPRPTMFSQVASQLSSAPVSHQTGMLQPKPNQSIEAEMVGQPIETVVLRQAGAKNKAPSQQRSNTSSANSILPQQQQAKIKTASEFEHEKKLAERAARFSQPPTAVSSNSKVPVKSTSLVSVAKNILQGQRSSVKRNNSVGFAMSNSSLGPSSAKQVKIMASRKVVARAMSNAFLQQRNFQIPQTVQKKSAVPSGDSGFDDYKLQKALEEQKKQREAILKKKEERRQMLALSRKQSTDGSAASLSIAPSSLISSALETLASHSADVSSDDSTKKKTLKKVLITKAQYKALVQHMKSRGLPLPKSFLRKKDALSKAKPQAASKNFFMEADGTGLKTSAVHDGIIPEKPKRVVKECGIMQQALLQSNNSLFQQQQFPTPLFASHPIFKGFTSHVIRPSSTVLLQGISVNTKYTQLKGLAEKLGPLENIQMISKDSKAIIKFQHPQHAQLFASRYNGSIIDFNSVTVTLI